MQIFCHSSLFLNNYVAKFFQTKVASLKKAKQLKGNLFTVEIIFFNITFVILPFSIIKNYLWFKQVPYYYMRVIA